MAEDIRLSINFWQHPKKLKLIRRGGRKGLEAVRSLQILWCFCAQERTDGILTGMDLEDIELAADWRGKPGVFADLLLAGNWLAIVTPLGSLLGKFAERIWPDKNNQRARALEIELEEVRQSNGRITPRMLLKYVVVCAIALYLILSTLIFFFPRFGPLP